MPHPNSFLSVAYLLEAAPMFGGVKVVLQQANLLAARGHHVTVICPGEPPDWFHLQAEFLKTPGLDPVDIPPADVTVATYGAVARRYRAAHSAMVAEGVLRWVASGAWRLELDTR